jgi:hypothetical protein
LFGDILPQNALAGNITIDLPDQQADDPVIPVLEKRSDSLGIDTEFASTAQSSRKLRYRLQREAQMILPWKRVYHCCKTMRPDSEFVQIHKSKDSKSAHFRGLMKCGSPWDCPVCSAQISEERRKELTKAVGNSNFRVVLVTYTLSHHKGERLVDVLDALKKSYKFMRNGRKWADFKADWNPVGSIVSHEVTYGENGWHPHRHELMFFPADTDEFDIELIVNELKHLWIYSVNHEGYDASWEHGLDVKTDENINREYIAKYGRDPKDAGWTVVHELAKAPSKTAHRDGLTPFQLLWQSTQGNIEARDLFAEYADGYHGTHPLHYSKGLRDLLGMNEEISDEDIAMQDEQDDSEHVISIARAQWDYIKRDKRELRGELLNLACRASPDEIWQWLYSMGCPKIKIYKLNDESTW